MRQAFYFAGGFGFDNHPIIEYICVKYMVMTTKEKVISGLKKLPDSVTIDDILDQIILVEKIEKGIDQSDKNQIVPDDELDQRLGKWLS